jgi:transcriptional regulator GlxA family with amidase domain
MKRAAEERARVPLSAAGSAEVGRQLEAMLAEFTSRRPGQDCAVKARMMDVLAAVLRDPESRLGPDAPLSPLSRRAMVEEALWYLRLNFMNPVRVADVLRLCPMSRSHFHAVFREVTGRTLVAALRGIRVDKAKELLAGSDLGILEISLQCGFGSLSHFCHTFRALAGCAPRDWRQLARREA